MPWGSSSVVERANVSSFLLPPDLKKMARECGRDYMVEHPVKAGRPWFDPRTPQGD